jgi:hypothetical protein
VSDEKLRAQLRRIVISMQDLRDAEAYTQELLKIERRPEDEGRRILRRALQIALVISYGRPFTKSRSTGAPETTPDLPHGLLQPLIPEHKKLHRQLLTMRRTEYAHSDAASRSLHAQKVRDIGISATLQMSRDPFTPMKSKRAEVILCLIRTLQAELERRSSELSSRLPDDASY